MTTPENAPFLAMAQELMRRCYAEEDAPALIAWLSDQIAKLGAGDPDAVMTWEQSFDLYDQLLAKREADAALPPEKRRFVDWPWASWNRLIDPLDPGMLAVLSAGDGMGKTIYAECIAEHWARKGLRVAFLHYELNRSLVLDRRAARHTNIPRRILKSGVYTQEQRATLATMRPKMLAWDAYITYVHTPNWSMEKAVAKLRELRAEGNADVVVLDYLEKNSASRRQLQLYGSNAFQREADNVEQLKSFAEATETPVLMLAQMSKAGKSSGFANMDRTDMRGAGEKSEKANLVVLLHRDRTDDGTGYSQIVRARVDKNTMGATGDFDQWMEPELFRVHDLELDA